MFEWPGDFPSAAAAFPALKCPAALRFLPAYVPRLISAAGRTTAANIIEPPWESQEVFSNAAHGDNHHHSTVRLQSITCSSETRLSSSQDTAYVTDHGHCSIASGLAKYNILTNCTMASLSMVSHHRSQTCSPQAHRSSTVFLWKHLEITTASSYTPGVLTECTGFLSATPSFFSSVVPYGLEVF